MPRWLNVGCGPKGSGLQPPGLKVNAGWAELRLDSDLAVQPDVLAPAHDLSALEDGCMDAVFSSHCIEHLYLDQAVPALCEWRRVLQPEGFLLLVCPDLQAAAEMVAHDRLFEVAYAGIRPYDIIFSHQGLVAQGRAQGHSFMEHKSGYTLSTLRQFVNEAGFAVHAGMRLRPRFELWLIASVQERSEADMRALAQQHFLWPVTAGAST
jgi:predicted SAM-dependent methyltransferase